MSFTTQPSCTVQVGIVDHGLVAVCNLYIGKITTTSQVSSNIDDNPYNHKAQWWIAWTRAYPIIKTGSLNSPTFPMLKMCCCIHTVHLSECCVPASLAITIHSACLLRECPKNETPCHVFTATLHKRSLTYRLTPYYLFYWSSHKSHPIPPHQSLGPLFLTW